MRDGGEQPLFPSRRHQCGRARDRRLRRPPDSGARARRLGRFAGFLLALVGFGFSAYLTYLELFVIDAICQWCVASACLMTLLFVVNAWRMFGYAGRDRLPAVGEPG